MKCETIFLTWPLKFVQKNKWQLNTRTSEFHRYNEVMRVNKLSKYINRALIESTYV